MKEEEMTCMTCSYGKNYHKTSGFGRTEEGVPVNINNVWISDITCYGNPKPQRISLLNGDIEAEPETHRCGCGRWFNSATGVWEPWFSSEE